MGDLQLATATAKGNGKRQQRKLLSHVRRSFVDFLLCRRLSRRWRRRVSLFSVMRHFDTKAQMHIKNAYPKNNKKSTMTKNTNNNKKQPTSQVSLTKALKYTQISSDWRQLPLLPPPHFIAQKPLCSYTYIPLPTGFILANAPVSLTTPLWPKNAFGHCQLSAYGSSRSSIRRRDSWQVVGGRGKETADSDSRTLS